MDQYYAGAAEMTDAIKIMVLEATCERLREDRDRLLEDIERYREDIQRLRAELNLKGFPTVVGGGGGSVWPATGQNGPSPFSHGSAPIGAAGAR